MKVRPQVSIGTAAPLLSQLLAAAGVLFASALPASAQPPGTAFETRVGGQSLTLVRTDERQFWLESDATGRRRLELPASAEIRSLTASSASWFAAGIDRDGPTPALLLLRGSGVHRERLRPPATGGPMLSTPVMVAGREGLRGLLWLEGQRFDALAVKAARFGPEGFGAVETLAAPGPGSQTALTATALDDGGMLAAWAGFDGEDDEVFWSRSRRRSWSAPARVGNDDRVPDITPSLVAVAGGALLSWSAYDGHDYRIMLARFEHGTWSTPHVVGERGSVLPSWAPGAETPLLIYKTARPRTWTMLAVAADATPGARVSLPLASNLRPLVARSGDQLTLHWPGAAGRLPPTRLELKPLAAPIKGQ